MKQGWVTNIFNDQVHYVNDKIHNEHDAAIIYVNGDKAWYKNGLCHRVNGPAIKLFNGKNIWIYAKKHLGSSDTGYTQEQFESWQEQNKNPI